MRVGLEFALLKIKLSKTETGKFVERCPQCSQSGCNGRILGDPGGLCIEAAEGWV